jgi:hypothetical protein
MLKKLHVLAVVVALGLMSCGGSGDHGHDHADGDHSEEHAEDHSSAVEEGASESLDDENLAGDALGSDLSDEEFKEALKGEDSQ